MVKPGTDFGATRGGATAAREVCRRLHWDDRGLRTLRVLRVVWWGSQLQMMINGIAFAVVFSGHTCDYRTIAVLDNGSVTLR
jgi:hypothetical protein